MRVSWFDEPIAAVLLIGTIFHKLCSSAHRSVAVARLLLSGICLLAISDANSGLIPPLPEIPAIPIMHSGGDVYHLNNDTGRDLPDGGSGNKPWKTFKYAIERLKSGDRLIIHGTKMPYQTDWAALSQSGSEENWITIEGKAGNAGSRPMLQGRLSLGDDAGTSVSHVHVANLNFLGGGAGGVNIGIHEGSRYLVFSDIEIDCQRDPENSRAIWTANHVKFIWFRNMNVHHCGFNRMKKADSPPDWKPPTDCGGICVKGDEIDQVTFINVRVADNVGDGIGGGSRKTNGKTYFKSCIAERNTGDGFDPGGGLLVVFKNSIARNNGGHQGAGFKFWSKESWVIGSVAYKNVFNGVSFIPRHENNKAYIVNSTLAMNAIGLNTGQVGVKNNLQAGVELELHVYNNIFHSMNTSSIVIDNIKTQVIRSEGYNYHFSAHDSARKTRSAFKDAIHMRARDGKEAHGYAFSEIMEGGEWNAASENGVGNIGEISTSVKKHPGFRDLKNGDLRLTKGSHAIDAGTDLGITVDIEGKPIPNGAGPDMGAYEYYD
jgi:hypothetical protein